MVSGGVCRHVALMLLVTPQDALMTHLLHARLTISCALLVVLNTVSGSHSVGDVLEVALLQIRELQELVVRKFAPTSVYCDAQVTHKLAAAVTECGGFDGLPGALLAVCVNDSMYLLEEDELANLTVDDEGLWEGIQTVSFNHNGFVTLWAHQLLLCQVRELQ